MDTGALSLVGVGVGVGLGCVHTYHPVVDMHIQLVRTYLVIALIQSTQDFLKGTVVT